MQRLQHLKCDFHKYFYMLFIQLTAHTQFWHANFNCCLLICIVLSLTIQPSSSPPLQNSGWASRQLQTLYMHFPQSTIRVISVSWTYVRCRIPVYVCGQNLWHWTMVVVRNHYALSQSAETHNISLPYLKHTIAPQGTITVLLVVLQLHCNSGGYMYLSGRKLVQVHCHIL